MIEPRVQAAINLHAILRDLEDLVALDPTAAAIVRATRTRVTFRVVGLRPLALTFTDGTCTASAEPGPLPAGHHDVQLGFATPQHLNALVDGKGIPVPLKGFRGLGFLTKEFTALTKRLEAVLRPAPGAPRPPEEERLAAELTAYAAFYALAEVGNLDPLGRANAARMADGAISVEVADGPAVTIRVRHGHLDISKGADPHARARMLFDSTETAGRILTGELDSYAAMGDGRLAVSGYIPLLDHMNKLLAIVARYLA